MSRDTSADLVNSRKTAARAAIRASRRERREASGASGRDAEAAALSDHAMAWLTEHEQHHGRMVGCVTAYQEMSTEPPVSLLVQALTDRGVCVLMPVTLPEGVLRWRAYDSTGQDQAALGPEALGDVDVAFIPALALSPTGVRLGQGGGYYDRAIPALRTCGRGAPVVAVVYPQELGADVPAHRHDIAVDAALTTDGVENLSAPTARNSP